MANEQMIILGLMCAGAVFASVLCALVVLGLARRFEREARRRSYEVEAIVSSIHQLEARQNKMQQRFYDALLHQQRQLADANRPKAALEEEPPPAPSGSGPIMH